jgi:hypothetical protein
MNKSLIKISVALSVAFSSVPSRASDNYKIMTCFHGHPRFQTGVRAPMRVSGPTEASKTVSAPRMP